MQFALAAGTGFRINSAADFGRYAGAVSAAGFTAVSLNQDQLAPFAEGANGGLSAASAALTAEGLVCTDFMSVAVRREPRAELDDARRAFAAAGAMGAASVTIICFTPPTPSVVARIAAIGELAAASGVRLGVEFCPGLVVDSIPTALSLLAEVSAAGGPAGGLTLDTWHFFRGSSTWADLQSVPLESIAVVQFDDGRPSLSDDVTQETNHRRAWPGEGEFELKRFASELTQRGWDGVVSVEVLSDEARTLSVEDYAQRAYLSSRPYWS
jgi:sugar phosphate isomerase/epimerase